MRPTIKTNSWSHFTLFINYIFIRNNINIIPIYINANKDSPTIPVIIPAFPILLPVFLADIAPNTTARIPVGKARYQNKAVTIDIIPKTREATCAIDLFTFFSFITKTPIYYFIFISSIKSNVSRLFTFIAVSDTVYKLLSMYKPRNSLE